MKYITRGVRKWYAAMEEAAVLRAWKRARRLQAQQSVSGTAADAGRAADAGSAVVSGTAADDSSAAVSGAAADASSSAVLTMHCYILRA